MSFENDKPTREPSEKPAEVAILRPHNGLTAAQELFARLYCAGHEIGSAHMLAYPNNMDDKTHRDEGAKLLKRPGIVSYCAELLKQAKIEEIDNPGQALRDLLSDIATARQDKNWSAVASMSGLRMKVHSMLKDRQIVENIESMSDEQLIKELGGGDPDKEELVRSLIGA